MPGVTRTHSPISHASREQLRVGTGSTFVRLFAINAVAAFSGLGRGEPTHLRDTPAVPSPNETGTYLK